MNDDILERLIIDRCSGELEPDANALLAAWLERDPAAQARAKRIEETLRLARRILEEEPEPTMLRPSFRPTAWVPQWAGVAASFAAGLGLGWLALHRPSATQPPAAAIPAGAVDSSFWTRRPAPARSQTSVSPHLVLQWTSPVKEPVWRRQL